MNAAPAAPAAKGARRAGVVRTLRRYAISGLLFWLPVVVTVFVVRFILQLMDGTLLLLPANWRPDSIFGLEVPGLGALLAVAIVLLTGLLVTNFIGRWLISVWEELLERIPFIRALYGGVKSFSESLLAGTGSSFKQVMLIEYPSEGTWSVGFQTTDNLAEINERLGSPHVCVFIPTTPNPTSGFIVMVPRARAIPLSMTVDEAMKFIVTLGVVAPAPHGASAATAQAAVAQAAASLPPAGG